MPPIPSTTSSDLLLLFERLGSEQAERRMQLQVDHSATLFGAGRGHLHFENIHAIRTVLETFLTLSRLDSVAAHNCCCYRVERQNVLYAGLPPVFDGYRILQLSDLHADALIDGGAGIITQLTGLKYDLAVITGDYRYETNNDYQPCLIAMQPLIDALDAKDGRLGILGNHDFLEMVPTLERMGLRILLNEHVSIIRGESELVIAGVDDPHFYGSHDLVQALGDAGAGRPFTIMLAHSPEIAVEAEEKGVNLYLCGHTHGGQICLPGGLSIIANASCGFRLLKGPWNVGRMQGYTSRGTGFSTAAARFFCPPEITVHTLRSA
jgi:predicted MPP superfamily phosphohydrolase